MAEDTSIGVGTEAPAPQSSESHGNQLSDLSIDELAEAVAEALEPRIFRSSQSHTDSSLANLRKEILPYLEVAERTSEEVKQTTTLVRALARGDVLTEEQMESMDKARAEAVRIRRLETENARLQEQTKGALEQSGLNEQEIDSILTTQTANHLVEFAREQGYVRATGTWDDLLKTGVLPKERIASKGDDFGVLRFEREGRANIRAAADAKLHDETPPPKVVAARSAGDTQQDKSAYSLFQSGFAQRRATKEVPR